MADTEIKRATALGQFASPPPTENGPPGRAQGRFHLGNLSLALAAGGFLGLEVLQRTGVATGMVFGIGQSGFEAATVGAMADWYAVHVLFHSAPVPLRWIPLFQNHSDIIVRQREKLTKGAVDLIQDKWLTPEVIGAHLRRFSPSRGVLDYLADPSHLMQAQSFIRMALTRLAESLDQRPAIPAFLEKLIREHLNELNLARPLGQWIQQAMTRGQHQAVWEGFLRALEDSLVSPDISGLFAQMIQRAVREYAPVLLQQTERPELIARLGEALKQRIQGVDLASSLGRWIRDGVEGPPFDPLFNALLDAINADGVEETPFGKAVMESLRKAATEYLGLIQA